MSDPISRRDWLGAAGAAGVVLLFWGILYGRDPLLFWNDDFAISILPVFADVARSWAEGTWPLLSSSSWVGGNLAGEYQFGTFSLFVNAVVVALWQLPLSFPQQAAALSLVHLGVLAAGGYLLARSRGLREPFALLVALVAAGNGWIVCWGATNWFGALAAFAWLPWCWWAGERALASRGSRWRFLWPAPFVYLLITGGFPYTVLMLGVLYLWLAVRAWESGRVLAAVYPLLAGALLGLGLSAPAWLALFDHVQGSVRAAHAGLNWPWTVPLPAWPGLVLPSWTVAWTDFLGRSRPHTGVELATGLAVPAMIIWALLAHGRRLVSRFRWEIGLLLLLALIATLPSAGVFRWSFRWLPFFHLVLAMSAAHFLQASEMSGERLCPAVAVPDPGVTGGFGSKPDRFYWSVD